MAYDYTNRPRPRGIELIPQGTIATVQLTIRAGEAGEDGLLKRSGMATARCSTANSSSSTDHM